MFLSATLTALSRPGRRRRVQHFRSLSGDSRGQERGRRLPDFCFLWPVRRRGKTGEKILPYLMEKRPHVAAARARLVRVRWLARSVRSHDSAAPRSHQIRIAAGRFHATSLKCRRGSRRGIKCETCHSAGGPGSGTVTQIGFGFGPGRSRRGRPPRPLTLKAKWGNRF